MRELDGALQVGGSMPSLWSIAGDNVHVGYANLRSPSCSTERELNAQLETMWAQFSPYADADFVAGFASDPDARFWEMHLGCRLLEAGKTLLPAAERGGKGGLPDICVVDGDRKFWIEAIAPDKGEDGPDQVVGPKPINEGGGFEAAPVRQAQLRMTGALWEKSQAIAGYLASGAIAEADIRLVAIGVGRFGAYVSEDPPAILSAVFPIGDEFVTIDKATGEVVDQGFMQSLSIEKKSNDKEIPRTAFIDEAFQHISGVIWSRAGIGNFDVATRPLTLVHNPLATVALDSGWDVWGKEYLTERKGESWTTSNIKGSKPQ